MSKRKKRPHKRLKNSPPRSRPQPAAFIQSLSEEFLHPQACDDRPWKHLPLILVVAFAVRAVVSLVGEFILHPDELLQYLEPAHRLAFGNGVVYWEYFYGARSWLIPGLLAGFLKLFDLVGLGSPEYYVDGIKLVLSAFSLGIPAGMYFFARRHFNETTARVALIAGALWYELVGFAHKPMTEFLATVPLLGLMVLCVRPSLNDARTVWLAAALAVLAVAIRMQYAPLALVLLGIVFLRTNKKLQLVSVAAGCVLAVGVFDALTWDSGLFHSYVTNIGFNLAHSTNTADESPFYQYLTWLVLATGGLSILCLAAACKTLRRYGFVLVLIALVVLVHSSQHHKEYRFIFVVIPLWLMVGADLLVRWANKNDRAFRWAGLVGAVCALVSVAGILNLLPEQQRIYKAWSKESEHIFFVRNPDPILAAYRYLARNPDLRSVWNPDHAYYAIPGYYYLHRKIPLYDALRGQETVRLTGEVGSLFSHIVTRNPDLLSIPGYSVERTFGDLRILRRNAHEPATRLWHTYTPTPISDAPLTIMRRFRPQAPSPPANSGIRFVDMQPEREP